MSDSADSYVFAFCAVDEGVRKAMQWKEPTSARSGCAKPWMHGDELCGPSELGKKGIRY